MKMKGSIRMIFGAIMLFGSVGAIESDPNINMVIPLVWIVVGIMLLVFGTKSMLENN
jgi:hypothetical protein